MGEGNQGEPAGGTARTAMERVSDRELVITRTVAAPARLVFEAWTTPELFGRWWMPKSFSLTLIVFEADIRTGGTYRLVTGHPRSSQPMTFFGRYLEVTPHTRLVWTNDEAGADGAVNTVTLAEIGDATRVVVSELHPTKAALDEALASGATSGWDEQFTQLDALVADLGTGE